MSTDSRESSASIPHEWTRLRAMRKEKDIDGLLRELGNPRESHDKALGRDVCQTIRGRAIHELRRLGTSRAVQPIARLLVDPEPTVRANAAIALGQLGDDSVAPLLVKALEDREESVRYCAARSLGQLCFQPGVPPLVRLLEDDPNPRIRLTVARSLASIGDKAALKPMKVAARKQGWRHPSFHLRLQKALITLRFRDLKKTNNGV